MKIFLWILFFAFTFQLNAQESVFENKYFLESGKKFINVAKRVKQNEKVTDAEWEELFQTIGYYHYLKTWSDRHYIKEIIREGILIAFSEDRKKEADSIAAIQVNLDSLNWMSTILVQNFSKLSTRLEMAEKFLEDTDFLSILEQANRKTKEFLPERAYIDTPELLNTYVIGMEPNAQVRGNKGIFLDLNLALDYYIKGDLVNLFAHEFYHIYRSHKQFYEERQKNDPLKYIIDNMHDEGCADLIDKEIPFTHLSSLWGSAMHDTYTQEFLNTPKTLKAIDSIVVTYIRGEAKNNDYYTKLRDMVKFNGHTNGFYMALVIKKAGGLQDMIDSYDNPVTFIKLYNKAAEQSDDEYVFSPEFIGNID